MKKLKLITILGPTASGKSELGIYLAKEYGSSIISGDAFQVYKGLDIGTAKVTKEESCGIKHYLVDCMDVDEPYSAAKFKQYAEKYIKEENENGRIPILVGGTGLYIQGLLEGYDFRPEVESTKKWKKIYEEEGEKPLIEEIKKYTSNIKIPKDKHRLIRLLELLENGVNKTVAGKSDEILYDGPVIGIETERNVLYSKINLRVQKMIEKGLKKEVENLINEGVSTDCQAFKAIGYKEMVSVIKGEISLEDGISLIMKNTRHFAKRQITWYKRMPYIHWTRQGNKSKDDWYEGIKKYVNSTLKEAN